MSAEGKDRGSLIAADEIDAQQACQQFALSSDQLVGLYTRRLSCSDSYKLKASYVRVRVYKVCRPTQKSRSSAC